MRVKRFVMGLAAILCLASVRVQAVPALATYGQLPGFENAAISPSGDHVAIVGMVDGVRRLIMLDANDKVVTTADIGTVKIRGIEWAGDQSVLIHFSATVGLGQEFTTEKAEVGSVLVVPVDGTKPWVVFAGREDITGGVWETYGVIQREGRWYGYFGGITLIRSFSTISSSLPDGALRPDLYEVDLQTRNVRRIAQRHPGNSDRDWLIDRDGAVGATLDLDRNQGDWTIYGPKHVELASGTNKLGQVSLVGFSADGANVIYARRDENSGSDQWFSVPMAGGTPQPMLADEDITNYFETRGHRLIGYTTNSANDESHFFDQREEKIFKASQRAFPGERMTLVSNNDAFDKLLVTTEGPNDPTTWWKIDIHTGKADIIGSSYPIAGADVGPMRMVPYVAADGLKMEGVLTLPPGRNARNVPAIMLPHGGPTYHDTAGFDWLAQAFASRGYAVFQPNFRGSSGYGTAFELAGNGEWGRKMQTDISDGLAELVRQGIVDPKRVCIVGASYGGYAALAGVTLQQGLYRCSVAVAGLSDLEKMVIDEGAQTLDDGILMRNLKSEIGSGKSLKAASPINFVDRVSVPVLLIHGKNDTVVNISQSIYMANALRHAGKTVEFVTLPGEDHWLSKSETRLAMLQAAMDFVTRYNPPDVAK